MNRPVGPIGTWACMTCDADNWRNRTYCAECGEPRLRECEYCNGSGDIEIGGMPPLDRSKRCPACKGTGEITSERARDFEQEEQEELERLTNP